MNKKFAVLLVLMAALVLGAVTSAAAAEIKASGSWQVDAQLINQWDFNKAAEDKTFDIGQRLRTAFSFIANENLKGVMETQIGPIAWGNGAMGIGAGRTPNVTTGTSGANVAGDGNLMLRKAYLDFKWPNTKVNFLVGYQSLTLPSAVGGGSPVLDDHFAAAAVVLPVTDTISLVAGYGRLLDSNAYGAATTLRGHGTTTDTEFLIGSLDFKAFKLEPWVAYADAGRQTAGAGAGVTTLAGFQSANSTASEGVRAYWGGAAFTMTALDPFKIMADFNYGKATYNNGSKGNSGRSGYLFDAQVDYTGLSMMTPSAFFAYSSGENGNSTKSSKGSERMPVVGSPQNYALGSFWLQGGDSQYASLYSSDTTMGYWALGASLKDIKLIDKLSHTVNLIYFKGTNNVDYLKENTTGTNASYSKFLTTKDSLWEVDLNSKYQVYEELTLALELGYINQNFDQSIWRATGGANANLVTKDAYKAALLMMYSF